MLRSAAIAALTAATLMPTATAAAGTRVVAEKHRQISFTDAGVTECSGFTLTYHFDVVRTLVEIYDDEGELLREVVHVRFAGTATNDSSGGSLPVDGRRHIIFDYEDGTFTETGVLRHVTAPGEGIVLHDSGRRIEDLEDETIVRFSAGGEQLRTGDIDAFCAALSGS